MDKDLRTLDYASPRTVRAGRETRLIIVLLLAFLALGLFLFGTMLYTSHWP